MVCVVGPVYAAAASAQAGAITKAAIADAAVSVAIMLWQKNTRKKILKDQNDLADRQVKLAEQVHAHEEKFWPKEKDFLYEFFSEPKHETDYVSLPSQWVALAKQSMTLGRSDWLREMERRCLNPTRCEDARWKREDMRNRSDMMTFADRHSEARTNALNDNRYSKQYSALSLSKGLMNEIAGYTVAMGTARGAANNILMDSVNSVSNLVGYAASSAFQATTGSARWGQGESQHFRLGVE